MSGDLGCSRDYILIPGGTSNTIQTKDTISKDRFILEGLPQLLQKLFFYSVLISRKSKNIDKCDFYLSLNGYLNVDNSSSAYRQLMLEQ